MPANIARIDGTDQAWYADKPAWHNLGTVTPGARTAQQVIKAIPLFRKPILLAPIAAKIGGKWVEIEGRRATYRGGTSDPLGIVADDFPTDMNDQAALEIAQTIIEKAGSKRRKPSFVTAGLLGKGGARGFASIDLTVAFGDLLKVKRDPSRHESHLFCTWAHDGDGAWRGGLFRNRIECQNLLNAGLAYSENAGVLARIIHAGDMQAQIREATRVLGFAEAAIKADTRLMNALAETPVKPRWMRDFVEFVVPTPTDEDLGKRAVTARQDARDLILGLYENSKTLVGVPKSAYRAYQAVAEYADHGRPLRIGADTPALVAADRRFRSITEGPAADIKERALGRLREEFELVPAKA